MIEGALANVVLASGCFRCACEPARPACYNNACRFMLMSSNAVSVFVVWLAPSVFTNLSCLLLAVRKR